MNRHLSSPFNGPIIIGGTPNTQKHRDSGGIRWDIIRSGDGKARAIYDLEYVNFSPNEGSYGVYKMIGLPYYVFYVHIKNPRKGIVKQGAVIADMLNPTIYLHIHVKIGGYTPFIQKYLDWMQYIDPSVDIKVGPGVGTNWIPKTRLPILVINDTEMVQLQLPIQIETINTNLMNLRKNPDTTDTFGQIVPSRKKYSVTIIAKGENVKQNNRESSTWYKITEGANTGWVNGCWINEIKVDETEVQKLKQEVETLNTKVAKAIEILK